MNEKKVCKNKFPEVCPMTRAQAKEFRAQGLDPLTNPELLALSKKLSEDKEKANYYEYTAEAAKLNDRAEEWILDTIYPDFDFAESDNDLVSELARKTYERTFRGKREEEKNS